MFTDDDTDFLKRVEDFFDPWDLVLHLKLTIEDITEVYTEEVLALRDELDVIMGYKDE